MQCCNIEQISHSNNSIIIPFPSKCYTYLFFRYLNQSIEINLQHKNPNSILYTNNIGNLQSVFIFLRRILMDLLICISKLIPFP